MIWFINTIVTLGIGIVCLWESTISMREQGVIRWFLPPFMLGVAYCMLAALYFYELAGTLWHLVFTVVFLIGTTSFIGAYFYLFSQEDK